MNLAIIPARGGSKRIPRKNIKLFLGKPIISYSIETAINANIFERVIVSTDDHEIAEIAASYGAEVPFMRPDKLSSDTAGTTPVISHAIKWLKDHGDDVENVCCIYATAPFIKVDDLSSSYQLLLESNKSFVFSVAKYDYPVMRSFHINGADNIKMLFPEYYQTRSQDLKEVYHDAGQFYWGRSDAWEAEKIILSEISAPFLLPTIRVQDIDTEDDWKSAELKYKVLQLDK